MYIFYKDIAVAVLCLSNDGDPILNGHKYTNQYSSPHITNNITLFLLVLTKMSILSSIYMQESDTRVVRTWRSGGETSNTILFTIPIELARQYELNEPTNVLMMATDKGILIRKLEVPTK